MPAIPLAAGDGGLINRPASRTRNHCSNFPNFPHLLHDGRFVAAVAIAAIAGLVRGFSGFGSALIYMPLISALYGPRVAAPTLLLIDTICALPFAFHAAPQCNPARSRLGVARRLHLPAARRDGAGLCRRHCAALVHRCFGAGRARRADLRLALSRQADRAASLAVGAFAGFGGGAVQIGAPPLLIFWLSGANKAATVRANIMVYFLRRPCWR